ncbi:hypothetical protein LCGC14_0547180 [marine sediment metagenome]|uniref:Uncharacterized protein n=1 Tax=marine sediment metagenome TaxID=412755 RepID=A0A0F9UCD4_9ZZZZ
MSRPNWAGNETTRERARILGVTNEPECVACSAFIYCGSITWCNGKHTCRHKAEQALKTLENLASGAFGSYLTLRGEELVRKRHPELAELLDKGSNENV